jgi:probable F420-dependent oxidoreductase
MIAHGVRYGDRLMHYGVTMFMTDQTMGPEAFARAVESRGLHSIYLPEHTHIPVSRRTPPPTGDAELAEEYKRTLDPFVALAVAAAVTERVLLGTGICLVAQREPIVTAKAVATLDAVSGGRFVFGIGFGWNEDEIAHHAVPMGERRDVAREHMLAMQALWRDDAAEFHGRYVELAPSWSWPKPAPRRHRAGPPVLIGGAAGPKLFAQVAEYADGWIPIGGRGIRAALPDLHRACEAAGRDPAALRIVPFGTIPDPGKLEYYASLGIEEIVLRVPSGDADSVLPLLDRYAELAEP